MDLTLTWLATVKVCLMTIVITACGGFHHAPLIPLRRSSSSMAATVSTDNSLCTQIAFFPTRDGEHQQSFINTFQSSLVPLLGKEEGFVSGHIYRSLDGTRIALYEQWRMAGDCRLSYSDQSITTAVRKSLKFILEVDEDSVDRHIYETVGAIGSGGGISLNDPTLLVQFIEIPGWGETTRASSQDDLLDMAYNTLQQQRKIDGAGGIAFQRGAVHRSVDGVKAVNFAQWQIEDNSYWDAPAEFQQPSLYCLEVSVVK